MPNWRITWSTSRGRLTRTERPASFLRGVIGYDPDKFWHLVYEVPDFTAMKEMVALARERHAGLVYLTDATMPNPWGRLPVYWDAELALMAAPDASGVEGAGHCAKAPNFRTAVSP